MHRHHSQTTPQYVVLDETAKFCAPRPLTLFRVLVEEGGEGTDRGRLEGAIGASDRAAGVGEICHPWQFAERSRIKLHRGGFEQVFVDVDNIWVVPDEQLLVTNSLYNNKNIEVIHSRLHQKA